VEIEVDYEKLRQKTQLMLDIVQSLGEGRTNLDMYDALEGILERANELKAEVRNQQARIVGADRTVADEFNRRYKASFPVRPEGFVPRDCDEPDM